MFEKDQQPRISYISDSAVELVSWKAVVHISKGAEAFIISFSTSLGIGEDLDDMISGIDLFDKTVF